MRRMRRPMRVVGSMTAGRTVKLIAASFQSLLNNTNRRAVAVKNWRRKSAMICEVAT